MPRRRHLRSCAVAVALMQVVAGTLAAQTVTARAEGERGPRPSPSNAIDKSQADSQATPLSTEARKEPNPENAAASDPNSASRGIRLTRYGQSSRVYGVR
jgi:hypothetical protein